MILIYTFRTFPWKDELEQVLPDFFVFGKLKEDFERFCLEIETKKPDWIIGIAKGRRTIWESLAANQFNQGKIIKGGVEKYDLYIPEKTSFPIHETAWTTFCNWTAYKIQEFLERNKSEAKLSFLHLAKKDLPVFEELLKA